MAAGDVASVIGHQKLPPRLTEPVSAGPPVDLPLAKVEPIRNVGSVSVITYLRRGKNHCTTATERRE